MLTISILLVVIGIAFLLYSLKPTAVICNNVQSYRLGWRCLHVLIMFFILGYASFIYFIGSALALDALSLIVASIFFGGSIFVFLVARLSLKSILHLNAIAQEKHFEAQHDALTGLPNRQYFIDAVESVDTSQIHSYQMFLMDLDKFKLINDLSGHHVGDQLLITLAQRLNTLASDNVIFARIGGDEFAVLVTSKTAAETNRLAKDIVALTLLPFEFDEQRFHVGISIGIALYPRDGISRVELLKSADVAMYHAKGYQLGFSYYSDELAQQITLINRRIVELERAILSREIFLTYQPVVDLKHQRIIAVQTQARWQLNDGSEVSPSQFIPFARSNKLIHSITSLVLESSLSQLAQWHQMGHKISLHVSLTATDLQDEYIVRRIINLLAHHSIKAHFLTVGFSEDALLEDAEQAIAYTQQLRQSGIKIAINEFGTSFASLDYLPTMNVDQIKLDHSFTKDLITNPSEFSITDATIRFAHHMKINVLATQIDSFTVKESVSVLKPDALCGEYFGASYSTKEMTQALNSSDSLSPTVSL